MAQRSATTRSQQWVGDRSFGAKRTSDERSKHSFLTFSKNRNKKKRELPHLILFPPFSVAFPIGINILLCASSTSSEIHLISIPPSQFFFPSLSLLYRGRPAATSNLPVSNCVYESNRPYQVSIYHTAAAAAAAGLLWMKYVY